MGNLKLSEEINIIGSAIFGGTWTQVAIKIKDNLNIDIFHSDFTIYQKQRIPNKITGKTEGWEIMTDGVLKYSYNAHKNFHDLVEDLHLTKEQILAIPLSDRKKIWWRCTVRPKTIDFIKRQWEGDIPEEWGIKFYPKDGSAPLFQLIHEKPLDFCELPNIFVNVDDSIHILNRQNWTVSSMADRMRLITAVLTLFTGSPLSYTYLLGFDGRDVKFVRVKKISNQRSFLCPGPYNGHAYIKKTALNGFKANFTKMIDQVYNNAEREKVAIILSYFEELYTALHKETSLAFSFQLMEALAKYKRISIANPSKNGMKKDLLRKFERELCPSCVDLLAKDLQPEVDDFDQYIGQALDVIRLDDNPGLNPTDIKKIVRKYRNEVFHGGFFEQMEQIDTIIDALPEGYKRDLSVVVQAVAAILGAHFLLGLDFKSLIALKRSMGETIDD